MAINATIGINATKIGINATIDTSAVTAYSTIKPLIFLVVGIVIYSLFIFKFYRFLARRDLLKLKLQHTKHGFGGFLAQTIRIFLYIIEHLVLVPVAVFFWYAVLAMLLLFLSRNEPHLVLLAAMAIVGAVRVTSYYSEDLSRDLAKMIPFALLGVFIIEMNYSSIQEKLTMAKTLGVFFQEMIYYLIFAVGLEMVMRILHLARVAIKGEKKNEEKMEITQA